MDEIRTDPLRFRHHFDHREPLQDFSRQDLQLQFRKAIANATMNAETERHVLARASAVDKPLWKQTA